MMMAHVNASRKWRRPGKKPLFISRLTPAASTFGEIALLFNTARTANVIATARSVIWSIDRTEFTAIMQNTNETNYIER